MDALQKILESWAPMIILIVVWLYAMKKYYGKRQTDYMNVPVEHLKNLENTMERIAVALEKLVSKTR